MDKRALDKSTKYNTLHYNANKQKFASTVVETPKKSKGSSGLLSLQEYKGAKKEKLCYNCLSKEHERKFVHNYVIRIRIRTRRRLHTWCKSFPWMLLQSILR